MALTVDRAILAALFVESVMYGTCVTMGAVTIIVFLKANSEGALLHKRLLFVLLIMLVLATSHVILSFIRAFEGFIVEGGLPLGSQAYFLNISNRILVAKDAVFLIQAWLGDSVNLWRCYVVCGKSKKIIAAPLITMVAGIVCSCMIEDTLAHGSGSIFASPSRWIEAFHILMLVTIVYCNVAIVGRIWIAGNLRGSGSRLLPVLVVIIETSALYTSNLVAFLVVYLKQSNGQYIALDLITPLVPVVFCLIILQIKYHRVDDTGYYASASAKSITATSRAAVRQTLQCDTRRHATATVLSAFDTDARAIEVKISNTTLGEHYQE